jgi:hypothetical protein
LVSGEFRPVSIPLGGGVGGVSGFGLAGVFPGKQAVFDAVDVGQGVEAALWTTRYVLEAAWLQPAVADGVIRRLAAQEPIDIGQGDDAGVGEEFGHDEVCAGFGFRLRRGVK